MGISRIVDQHFPRPRGPPDDLLDATQEPDRAAMKFYVQIKYSEMARPVDVTAEEAINKIVNEAKAKPSGGKRRRNKKTIKKRKKLNQKREEKLKHKKLTKRRKRKTFKYSK